MKLLNESLLKAFIRDVKEAVRYYDESPRPKHFHIEPEKDGFVLTVVWDRWDEFSNSTAKMIGKRFCSLWSTAWGAISGKYKGIINQKSMSYTPCIVDRDDGGPEDRYFSPNVRIAFQFGSKLSSYATNNKYQECSQSLLSYINKITGESSINIVDVGEYCLVGNYFKYNYNTREIVRTGRLCLDASESIELARRVYKFLGVLSSFGVPLKAISVCYRTHICEKHYFYSVGDECLLWMDFYSDRDTYSRSIGIYFDL